MDSMTRSPDTTPAQRDEDAPAPAGLARRLGAMLYDALLLLALWFLATACFLPFTGGEAVTWSRAPLLAFVHRTSLIALLVGFYGTFWTRRGQTLGMASWRIRVERTDGALLRWRDVFVRIAAATVSLLAAGAGWLWVLVDQERRAWHDILSHTRVVTAPKRHR
jgi:uncharacterized RDD family membrane protein YckC